ncbi:MAG TPA: hypothetical protein VH370_08360 [Humisphaera sp.]|jgi:hypothetical protein|nr:hypothetical protein [Humisphaera sp.]
MTRQQIARINICSFVICLVSIAAGTVIGLLGIWGVIPTNHAPFWRWLGTCATMFISAAFTSMAIQCFKTNE